MQGTYPEQGICVSVDVMGGDNAPEVVLEGMEAALSAPGHELLTIRACGPAEIVEPFAAAHERCIAVPATEVIGMDEHPAQAVRRKKDSSLVVGCREVKEGRADGFFSAGSTGACVVAGTMVVGRAKGVKRPAIAMNIPSSDKPVVMLDVGANADCKPEYLAQFGNMGAEYMRFAMGVEKPTVALLNIGEEETKGSELAQQAHQALKEQCPEFVGNAEGRDIVKGTFNVIVTDGFTGNVCLKNIEGVAKELLHWVKDGFMKSPLTKIGALLVKDGLYEIRDKMSPDTYGGAPLLGLKSAFMIGHGSSNATAIKNGILNTARMAADRIPEAIANKVASDNEADNEAE